jgi:hypothetical protein
MSCIRINIVSVKMSFYFLLETGINNDFLKKEIRIEIILEQIYLKTKGITYYA